MVSWSSWWSTRAFPSRGSSPFPPNWMRRRSTFFTTDSHSLSTVCAE